MLDASMRCRLPGGVHTQAGEIHRGPDGDGVCGVGRRVLSGCSLYNPELKLSYDIETAYKQKHKNEDEFDQEEQLAKTARCSASVSATKKGTGISVTWSPQFSGHSFPARSRLHQGGWNCLRVRQPGARERTAFRSPGMVYDGMDMFHFYQSDLPEGLEFVTSFTSDMLPWKHLNILGPGPLLRHRP
jgi:hypothetical protein